MGSRQPPSSRGRAARAAEQLRARRRFERRHLGISAIGTAPRGDAEGDAGGAREALGLGTGATLLLSGKFDISDGADDARR